MKRYEVESVSFSLEIIIDGPAEEQALARLVARMNADSPTPLSVEEALSSALYDLLFAEVSAPLPVGALLDEADDIIAEVIGALL